VRQIENILIRKIAEHFKVAKSFLQKILKRFEKAENITLLAQGGSPPTKLNSDHLYQFSKVLLQIELLK
jgi:transposase